MARLKCPCGSGLNNSNVPSENVIYIFTKTEVDNTLSTSPNITLYDFETGIEEDSEYWYCPHCKRVLVVENTPGGKVIGSYSQSSISNQEEPTVLSAFYVFSDADIYNAEEINPNQLLSEFIHQNGSDHLYFADTSVNRIYRIERENLYREVYIKE